MSQISSEFDGISLQVMGQFLCEDLQLLIPFLAETADEGGFEETIEGHVELSAEDYGVATDIPAVVVESHHAIRELLGADGVEGAGDGFGKCRLTLAAGFL